MKNKLPTLTIGIPAYNEEANIGQLIDALLKQQTCGYNITKIIICSDGSDDKTKTIVLGYKDKRITFVENQTRYGQAFTQNKIIEMTNTDVLVLLNADILLVGKHFIDNLTKPILSSKADLTSSSLSTVKSDTYLGRVFNMSFQIRNEIFDAHASGNNLYTCHGAARAFSKSFYSNFRFQESVAEDAYSYLACISQGYSYQYSPSARALIKWPDNIYDHYHQSVRFFRSKRLLANSFSQNLLARSYSLSVSKIVVQMAKFFIKNPFYATTYFVIYIIIALITRLNQSEFNSKVWIISKSSKKLI